MDIPSQLQMTAMADQWGAFIRDQVGGIQTFMKENPPTPETGQELALQVFAEYQKNVEMEVPHLATFGMFMLFTLAMNVSEEDLRIPG